MAQPQGGHSHFILSPLGDIINIITQVGISSWESGFKFATFAPRKTQEDDVFAQPEPRGL